MYNVRYTSLFFFLLCRVPAWGSDPCSAVDPFIGTANGGNTFPGAVLPWGMVSVSPHNTPGAPSGYTKDGRHFTGFGHVHLSGTGCADLGSIIVTAVRGGFSGDPGTQGGILSGEFSTPGLYRALLPGGGVNAEVTATIRCGLTRLAMNGDDTSAMTVVIDAGRSLALTGGGEATLVSEREAEGFNVGGGFCGEANRHRVYFVARFSEPSIAAGVWRDSITVEGSSAASTDRPLGAWFRFSPSPRRQVLVKIGISYVSAANARHNLDEEIPDWDFDRVYKEARLAWDTELSRIETGGGTRADSVRFYTALYHSLIHPGVISDVNGEYPLMGRGGTGRYSDRERYSVFSLWDTYRTVHPLLTLVYPARQIEIIRTMLDMYRESGWLPKWELAGNETYMMVGDPAGCVIADSYINGLPGIDGDLAWEAVTRPARETTRDLSPPARPGYHEMLQHGYIPVDQDTTKEWWVWGPVSTMLEYALADWCISRMAERLGKTEDARMYAERSTLYRTLFDGETLFLRPKLRNGRWLDPFDPGATEGSGSWSGSGGPGYVEGNAWNYTWFVPHDVEGLVRLFGGRETFTRKLGEAFSEDHFTITNEPDIAYPYLFSLLPGEEHRTGPLVREIMERNFGTGPSGLPGNDDAGTLSAWFVFAALGFYPSCPASGAFELGVPLFPRVTIRLDGRFWTGTGFSVQRQGGVDAGSRVSRVLLNGGEMSGRSVAHRDIVNGGTLIFVMEK